MANAPKLRPAVAAGWNALNDPLEGTILFMYLDRKGLVTCAMGNLIDASPYSSPWTPALGIPWVHADGSPASRVEVIEEWCRVKRDPVAASKGWRHLVGICQLRMTREVAQLVIERKLLELDEHLAHRFPEFAEWPADAQLATLSLSWACGEGFRFPILERALRQRDFVTAARECRIRDEDGPDGKPGTPDDDRAVRARNAANRTMYMNAARVQAYHLDPDELVWPGALENRDEEQTAASEPTFDSGPPDSDDRS